MGLFRITDKNQRHFLRLIEEDFKQGLLDRDKKRFRELLDVDPENRKCLDRFKCLDKDLRNEGKKNIPLVDITEEVAGRCGILYSKRHY